MGDALRSVLVGVMVASIYVWPVLILTHFLAFGIPATIFWSVLGGSVIIVSLVTWLIAGRERESWAP